MLVVRSRRHNLKIVRSVVVFNFVDVMNNFIRCQCTTEFAFHYNAMLESPSAIDEHLDVAAIRLFSATSTVEVIVFPESLLGAKHDTTTLQSLVHCLPSNAVMHGDFFERKSAIV